MYRTDTFQAPPIGIRFRGLAGKNLGGVLVRVLCLVVSITATGITASGQTIGYVLNSADGTVTIFATTDNPGNSGTIAESPVTTVKVCAAPGNAAVTPDFNHVYVTCSDNSLWIIDATNIAQGTATAQSVSGLQLNAPGGIAISKLSNGSSTGKTLAYIVNSATNTVSVIDTSNNALYDGPIQLGIPPASGTGSGFAGLAAAAPDTTKVFVTTNNPTPQLWMIDTTVKPEVAVQIQSQSSGIPTAATDSIYLSVEESDSSSDYYVLLTSSIPGQDHGSVLLADIQPAALPGSLGSPSNAFLVTANIGDSQPNHVVSRLTGDSGPTRVVNAYTVDPTNLWQISFNCTAGDAGSCKEVTPGTGAKCVTTPPTPCASFQNIPEPGSPPPLSGLGITSVPSPGSSFEFIYVTDGQPDGMAQLRIDASNGLFFADSVNASKIQVGHGALSPVFSPLSATSAPIVFFTSLGPSVVPIDESVSAAGVAFTNPQNTVTVDLSFGTNNAQKCNDSLQPCPGTEPAQASEVGGSTTFPASGVYTVMLHARGKNSSGQDLPDGQATRTIIVGTNCSLTAANVTPSTTTIAVGQPITVNLSCLAPEGHSITGSLDWGDGTTPSQSAPVTVGDDFAVPFTFLHSYTAPKVYNLTLSLDDSTDAKNGSLIGPLAVTVNPLAVSVSPSVISVQVPSHSVPFAAAVQFDASNSGVTWTLAGDDCAGAACGALSNITLTSVTYTAPSAAPASGMVSLTATSKASISYPNPNKSFSVPIKLTALPPPSCTLGAPSTGQTGVSIKADVTCTAPAGDSLTATLNWGDGTSAATNSATVGGNGSADFSSFTHAYATASNPSYSIGLNVTDGTTGLAGSVTPPLRAIKVFQTPTLGPPAAMSSVSVVPGQSVMVPFNFSGGATNAKVSFDTIACAVAPAGPSCTVSPSAVILDNTGNGTVQLTVTTVGPETAAAVLRGQEFGWLSSSLIALPGLGFVFLGLGASTPRSKRLPGVLYVCLLVGLAILGAGCGSTAQRSNLSCTACTPTGSYTVTVMATSQKPLHASGTVTVVVVNPSK